MTDTPTVEAILGEVQGLMDRFHGLMLEGRGQESRATLDGGRPLGGFAWDLATIAWSVGGDHLLAWSHLWLEARKVPVNAYATLLRGALEGAVTTRWLVDSEASEDERRLRGAGAQLADYVWRKEFESGIGAPTPSPPAKAASVREAESRLVRRAWPEAGTSAVTVITEAGH